MKAQFDNGWMSLYCKSMSKVHSVLELLEIDEESKLKGTVAVGDLFGREATALQYPSTVTPSSAISGDSGTEFFIKSDGKFFAVEFVSKNINEINAFSIEGVELGVIATCKGGYHYLCRSEQAR